ncbi:MAG TPA: phage capsid protein [Vitreimonas sp.]|nr:phage capsid protein [Vitreimonas sp.]
MSLTWMFKLLVACFTGELFKFYSTDIDTALVNQFHSNITLLTQQKGSRLRGAVRVETQNAEFDFYDRIGATEAQEITGRHQDTPLVQTPHDRRRVGLRDFDWADLIDRQDRLKMLADPTGPYSMNAAFAFGRKMDDVIIQSAFDTAYSGKTGQTTVAFPAGNQIAHNYVESGSAAASALTIGKLRRAKTILDEGEVDPDEPRFIAVTAHEVQSLLRTTEVTNSDYNTVKALVEGKIDTFMGFKFIRTQRLLTDTSGYRRLICWARPHLLLAVAQELQVDIGPRRDKRNSTQVYASMGIGATRMEEVGVVEIKSDQSVL